jgi:hypothetical protein
MSQILIELLRMSRHYIPFPLKIYNRKQEKSHIPFFIP